jgi:T5orf172 domain
VSELNTQKQVVYILTNEAMPGIVKVGKTYNSIEQRMRELYKSGVPLPFECFHASVVENAVDVEGRIHRAFDKYRVNKNREFFEIEPGNILEILEMVEIENVTPNRPIVENQDDITAINKFEARKEKFSFSMVKIPIGAILTFTKDETKTSRVVDNNKVIYNGEELSLSKAALKALREIGYNWQSAHGAAYWMYKHETLTDRRERMEGE